MKRHTKLFGATLLSVGWSSLLFAGSAFYNFDQNPSSDPLFTGANPAMVLGTHNYVNGLGNQQIWCSGNPAGSLTGTNGFPQTGGYLSLADGTNTQNNLVVVFPDIDSGLPLAGFQIDLDLRVGNGSAGRPADGFAISFARAGDPALINATNGAVNGFAGGGSVAEAQNPAGSFILEAGTKTGVAVCFDAWQGNYLPDTSPYSSTSASNDREGIYVRVDDQTKVLIDLINNRNEADCTNMITNPLLPPNTYVGSAKQTTLNNTGSGLSEQTGTNAPQTGNFGTCSATYGGTANSGAFTNLYWEHLMVRLANISTTIVATNQLAVVWKGVTVILTNLDTFSATAGRLVLSGRCGGNNQNVHFDNIKLVTTPTTKCTLNFVKANFFGFRFQLADNPGSGLTVTSVDTVLLDGTNDVTSVVVPNNLTYIAPLTDGSYTQAVRFASLSEHTAGIGFHDSSGGSNFVQAAFIVPSYVAFPTSYVLPITAIDQTKAGFLINAYQTLWNNPNVIAWTDELFEGLHGTNMVNASTTGNPIYNGYQVWNNVLGFFDYGGKSIGAGNQGMFSSGDLANLGGATGDADFSHVGIGSGTYDNGYRHDFYDNAAMEIYGYIYFPTSGVYQMCFGNDDNWQLSVSQSPYDRLGTILAASPGARVPNSSSLPSFGYDVKSVFVDQAGVYPIRMVWENGTGGCSFEWYTYYAPGPNVPGFGTWLINDTAYTNSSPGGVVLVGYYDIVQDGSVNTGPYVKASQPARNPTGTSQTYADMYFYSPIVIDLVDGTTYGGNTGKQINDSTVIDVVDGVLLPTTSNRSGPNLRIAQSGTPAWQSGIHSNYLAFADKNGTNYTYSWSFGVVGGVLGVANLDITNTTPVLNNNVLAIPASLVQPLGSVGTPGVRVRTYQTPMEAGQSHSGWADGELLGQKGFNVADLSKATSGYFVWNGLFDFRYDSGGGGSGEWNFDLEDSQDTTINPSGASMFGVGVGALNPVISPLMPEGPSDPSYRFVFTGVNTKMETSAIEFSGWLAFQNAGYYIFSINEDDGCRLMFPQGSPMGKLNPATVPYVTNIVFESNTGRGIAGASGGVFNPGTTLFMVYVPTAGAYPFRLLWYNGSGGSAFEWSVVQANADGRVMRMPVNAPATFNASTFDPATANAVKVYQNLTTGDAVAPYIAKVNPVYDAPDAVYDTPTVVDIADGPTGKTINTSTANIQLFSDGIPQNVQVSQPTAGITHVVQQFSPGFFWVNGSHTNMLTYQDSSGTSYTNVWFFNARVPNNNIVWIPASQRVDPSQVDHGQPGFRVKGYQAAAGGGGNIQAAEQMHQGVFGPNLITVPPEGYFTWTNAIDFCDNINVNGGHGEFRYNYSFSNSFGATINAGGGNTENNLSYIFAGWFEFPQAGFYAMTVNSDDGFKITSPYGVNPFNEQGLILGWADGGRGDSGGNQNPFNGSSTPTFFYIPQPGAYPIRLIWYNGGGGLAVEWTMFQPTADGRVERALIGDFASYPNQVKVYQTLVTNLPSVVSSSINASATNAPSLVYGAQPQALLGSTSGFGSQTSSQLPLGTNQDFWLTLQDGTVGINVSTIQLSLNGVVQPTTVVTNPAGAGLNTVYRFGTNGLWPSGAWAPLMVSFQDLNGNSYSYPVEWVVTPFWGTLHNGFDEAFADPNSPGFKVRTYQVDPAYTSAGVSNGVSTGGLVIPNRVHISEQLLAGLWGPNWANLGPVSYSGPVNYAGFTDFGYFDAKGTGPTNGVVHWNAQYPVQAGDDFVYSTAETGSFTFNQPMPGLPGLGPTTRNNDRSNSVALEILAYVDFPSNGVYTLGVSSDDGFRMMQQWQRPANIAALVINSPAPVARTIPAIMNVCENQGNMSMPVTNFITGNLVLVSGAYGASTNGEGCVIANGTSVAGNIALMYQSKNGTCGIVQQVLNAAAAGARAVVMISKHTPSTDGVFPDEQTVSPMQPIPLVVIEESDGAAIVSALQSGAVNVTLTPEDYQFNPPTDRVLGQTSVPKGNNDCNFTVVVTNAPGIYPLRLVYWNGSGGVNVSLYSLQGTNGNNGNRILVNDRSNTNGVALNAYFSLVQPKVTTGSADQVTVTWAGTLLSSTDPTLPLSSWTTVSQTSPWTFTPTASQPNQYFRAVYTQRP